MFQELVVDLSHWNGDVDFMKLKNDGVWGVILKCGGAENGVMYIDKNFIKYYSMAKSQGLHVGAYWFTGMRFTAIQEASQFHKWISVLQFDLPVYIDFEVSNYTKKKENTQFVVDFIECMYRLGKYFVGVYASDLSGFSDRLDIKALYPYTWWVARYGNEVRYARLNCHIWQFTSKGRLSGVKGYVDMNYCYRDFPTIIICGHYNGY